MFDKFYELYDKISEGMQEADDWFHNGIGWNIAPIMFMDRRTLLCKYYDNDWNAATFCTEIYKCCGHYEEQKGVLPNKLIMSEKDFRHFGINIAKDGTKFFISIAKPAADDEDELCDFDIGADAKVENEAVHLEIEFDSLGEDWPIQLLNTELSSEEDDGDESDDDGEDEADDDSSYHVHGDHWDCVTSDDNDNANLNSIIRDATENGSLYGKTETSYALDDYVAKGEVFMLEKKEEGSPLCVKCLLAKNQEKSTTLVSMFPAVVHGAVISLKITKINEWENGLEATLLCETDSGSELCFFDTDYVLHKDEYKIGDTHKFSLGAFAYFAREPESKGFEFTGQKAIDFRAKIGEEPEYDEEGNVKPVRFSTEELAAFFQTNNHCPDDAEFITPIEKKETAHGFWNGTHFFQFNVTLRNFDSSDEFKFPCFVKDSGKNLHNVAQLQGALWLEGFLVE